MVAYMPNSTLNTRIKKSYKAKFVETLNCKASGSTGIISIQRIEGYYADIGLSITMNIAVKGQLLSVTLSGDVLPVGYLKTQGYAALGSELPDDICVLVKELYESERNGDKMQRGRYPMSGYLFVFTNGAITNNMELLQDNPDVMAEFLQTALVMTKKHRRALVDTTDKSLGDWFVFGFYGTFNTNSLMPKECLERNLEWLKVFRACDTTIVRDWDAVHQQLNNSYIVAYPKQQERVVGRLEKWDRLQGGAGHADS